MMEFLQEVRDDTQTEGRIIVIVNARGVDFPLTAETEKQLRGAGASTRVLAAVRAKAPAAKEEADESRQAASGAKLFDGMVKTLGGEAGIGPSLNHFSIGGSVTSFDAAGSSTNWNLTAVFYGNRAEFTAESSAGQLKLNCTGETCNAVPDSRLKSDDAQKLETNLRHFRNYQFAALIRRMMMEKTRVMAKSVTVPTAGEQHLRVECGGESYDILLDGRMLPLLVTVESRSGLGSGITIAFDDFAALGSSRYPKATDVKLPGANQGIRVRLDRIEPVAAP